MSTIDLDISSPMFSRQKQEEELLTGGSGPMPELSLEEEVAPPPFVMEKEEKPEPAVRPMPKAVQEPMEEKPAEKKKSKVTAQDTEASAQLVAAEIARNEAAEQPMYCFPPLDLLKKPMRGGADGTECVGGERG